MSTVVIPRRVSCGCDGARCRLAEGDPRHGTLNGYKNHYCRCPACRAENTRTHREYWSSRPKPPRPPRVRPTCDECGERVSRDGATVLAGLARRQSRAAVLDRRLCVGCAGTGRRDTTPPEHGTYLRYIYGCRCPDCRAANTARSRLQRDGEPLAGHCRDVHRAPVWVVRGDDLRFLVGLLTGLPFPRRASSPASGTESTSDVGAAP